MYTFTIGQIQNKTTLFSFTTAFLSTETDLFNNTKVEYLLSFNNIYANNGNINNAELNIPITLTLLNTGYVGVSTTDTTLNPNSIVTLLLYEADIPTMGI